MNIVDQIFQSCDSSAVALIGGGEEVTYGELGNMAGSVAGELEQTGFFRGREKRTVRVALNCPNGIDHIVLSLAVLRAGGCLVPVPDELTDPEREQLISVTGCDIVLCGEGRDWFGSTKSLSIPGARQPGTLVHGIRNAGTPLSFEESALHALNPALVRFSSGTTGHSKGVVLSHETLLDRVTTCNDRLGIGPEDRIIWTLPMAHHFAVSIVLYLLHGATTVILDSHLAEDVDEGIRRHRGTVIYGAPFHYQMLAEMRKGRPFETLRMAVSTAAPLPADTAAAFRDRYRLPLTQGLGIIEVGLPFLNNEEAEAKPLAVGKPQKGFEARILDPDPQGVGELLLRGPGMFDAYLSPWRTRRDVVDGDGWFSTGDLGSIDEDGTLTLRGRIKSVIIVAGMKVFPEEVEAVINAHPGIAESRVASMPHPVLGQVPAAELIATHPEDRPRKAELQKFCRERLSHYRVPLRWTWVDELPKTASGKLKR